MGARPSMPEGAAERLAPLLKEARSPAEYQRVQCVWLRATLGLNASQIAQALGWQASYENQLGYPVHHSVVYRALHRHGWRKIQPRPQHPKADAAAQEEFKKSFRPWSKKKPSSKPTRAARFA